MGGRQNKPLSLAFARQLPYRGEPLAKEARFSDMPRPLLGRRGGSASALTERFNTTHWEEMLCSFNSSRGLPSVVGRPAHLHLGNVTLSLSFMVILLLTAGVFFTLRTRLLPVRLFRDMLAAVCEKNDKGSGLSSFQTLVVSTATRWAWAIWWASWQRCLWAVQARCSGCG